MGRIEWKAGKLSRRELLRGGAVLAGGAWAVGTWGRALSLPQGAAPADPLAAMRAQMGAIPIERTQLAPNLELLGGPGGNVVILHGPDGKISVDSFMQPAWGKLKQILDSMGNQPIKMLIDTHWHFDHTDNNGAFHGAGATILAHELTKTRLMQSHEVMGMHFEPVPAAALPAQTFKSTHKLTANGETVVMGHIPPAHTDTDIYVHYQKANVLHCGDVFFNGMYPFFDAGTGGNINGMINGANMLLHMVDDKTKIVPGHGPLGDKAAMTRYRDVMVTVRDRVKKQKAAGKKLAEVVAAKPTADLDAAWGKGFMMPDQFVTLVYTTL